MWVVPLRSTQQNVTQAAARQVLVALATSAEHLSKTTDCVLPMLVVVSDGTAGESPMAEHVPGDPSVEGRFVRLDDGDMHVVEDGDREAPALLLLSNAAVP